MKTADSHKIRNCLISVFDKTGVAEFAKELNKLAITIYSTGGTLEHLIENGVNCHSIREITDFPEILDGRVKTLHPAIHSGLLARLDNEKHLNELKLHNLFSLDMLVVNLYPFEKQLDANSPHDVLIENIDIGGPAMLRAAAKNYLWTAPIVNPNRYKEIINLLKKNDESLPKEYREILAGEVFFHTSYYDSLIAEYFQKYNQVEFPERFSIPMKLSQSLRYGENPHQKAAIYGNLSKYFSHLHGKELSYNNILDIDAAMNLIIEFENPTVAIIKHTNPCGVGSGSDLIEAYDKAYATDTVSPYGGIIIVNQMIDEDAAQAMHSLFTEIIIAPEFSEEALAILTKKRDRRLIQANLSEYRKSQNMQVKSVTNLFLLQARDRVLFDRKKLNVPTKREPNSNEWLSIIFAWKIAKHVKSNSIIFSKKDRTLAIGAGQMSRVDSALIAIDKAKREGIDLNGSILASDAFFPYPDAVEQAAKAGVTAIVQPGGAMRDEQVIEEANKHNIAMLFTGIRHFRH
ncbi:MAG: bifunctional phosphoribosylaminoimidazolecarboxamide formyltransferase/IMP cyclohydrolase [Ignavibacteria bacterium]|jgi:phosphoribosylaminoimidazolecarboxamide formyltransferase/IMP cyclohydrolase|nr:bifunctional phosphoribosylaminoimidazolecarboxamide formyltransferase/IMP cyclohydrolase [Ignavibacteria bacterium]